MFFDKLQEDQVYVFSNGKVNLANQKFTSIKNDFCIVFDKQAEIYKSADDQKIQTTGFAFTPISNIENFDKNRTIDVIGIV